MSNYSWNEFSWTVFIFFFASLCFLFATGGTNWYGFLIVPGIILLGILLGYFITKPRTQRALQISLGAIIILSAITYWATITGLSEYDFGRKHLAAIFFVFAYIKGHADGTLISGIARSGKDWRGTPIIELKK